MTTREESPRPAFDIPAALQAANVGIGPVENSRRLVPLTPGSQGRVLEFYSSVAGSRLLAVPAAGEDNRLHTEMVQRGLPVLQAYGSPTPDLALLYVPPGTWPLGSRLHIIRRDLQTYGELLQEVARSQRHQHEQGLPVLTPTEGTRTVDNFVFSPDLRTPTGQQMSIIPPYNVSSEATPTTFVENLTQELAASGEFNQQQVDYLQAIMIQGVAGDVAG